MGMVGGEAAGGRIRKIPGDTIPPLFQSPRRSSASGSAPQDSTRQVRREQLPGELGMGFGVPGDRFRV